MALLLYPFYAKAKKWINGRRESIGLLQNADKAAFSRKRIWIHCSSLGEFEQARPLIELITAQHPEIFIFLSFFSPSGYETVRDKKIADCVFLLPMDNPKNSINVVQLIKPLVVLWSKYDFFYHYIVSIHKAKIPCVLFAARFYPEHIAFKPYGVIIRKTISQYSGIFVQDETSRELLKSIGVESIIAGDPRIDRVLKISSEPYHNAQISAFLEMNKGKKCVVAGSTWPPDDRLLAEVFKENKEFFIIVAPHLVDDTHVKKVISIYTAKGFRVALFSSLISEKQPCNVLIIDSIGQLSRLYRHGVFGYIGGGFGAGVHNVLEAAVYGIPIAFGPKHAKSIECLELQQIGVAFSVKKTKDLQSLIHKVNESSFLLSTRERLSNYFTKRAGGAEKIYEHVKIFLN
ncbi:MAG: hypothetical protein NZ522_08180 [Chitinophagales bacterium]|nr:hypothetical protein [Chitinophagales bacterium]